MHRGPLPLPLRHEDFDLENGFLLGCGALAFVNRCKHLPTDKWVAVKILSKVQVLQCNKLPQVTAEKEALYGLGPHPTFPFLYGTAQSQDELYFVMELLPNGDLLEHIRRVAGMRRSGASLIPCLTFSDTRTITAQLLLGLRHVFSKGFVLRDFKPENVCFRSNGRVVLVDFDTALANAPPPVSNCGGVTRRDRTGADAPYEKVSQIQAARRQSSAFCGTAQYVAPETIGDCVWSFASALFALGCTVYHMLAGEPLFNGPNAFFVMQEIRAGVATKPFPACFERFPGAESFIRALTETDPVKRLGVSTRIASGASEVPCFVFDMDAVKQHPFFSGFDWDDVDDVDTDASKQFEALAERLKQQAACSAATPAADDDDEVTDKEVQYWRELAKVPVPDRFNAMSSIPYDYAPRHSDEYAAYVHRVGDGPLERAIEVVRRASETFVHAEPAVHTIPDDDDVADVVDDVGISHGLGPSVDTEWSRDVRPPS